MSLSKTLANTVQRVGYFQPIRISKCIRIVQRWLPKVIANRDTLYSYRNTSEAYADLSRHPSLYLLLRLSRIISLI